MLMQSYGGHLRKAIEPILEDPKGLLVYSGMTGFCEDFRMENPIVDR